MKYKHFCEYCNYGTDRLSSIKNHNKSKKHIKNSSESKMNPKKSRVNPNYAKNIYCRYCSSVFSTSSNRAKHEKKCSHCKNITETEKLQEKIYDLKAKNKMDKMENEITKYKQMVNMLSRQVENLTKLANKQGTINNMTYISTTFTNPDELKSCDDYHQIINKATKFLINDRDKVNNDDEEEYNMIKNEDIISESDENDKEKEFNYESFVKDIITYKKMNSLHNILGDFLVSTYMKEDKTKQALHVTDSSRIKFVYAELKKNLGKIQWKIDLKGVNVGKIIIDPMLDFIRKYTEKFQKKLIKKIKNKTRQITDLDRYHLVETGQLLDMLEINNKKKKEFNLKKKIIEHILPYFELNKASLMITN